MKPTILNNNDARKFPFVDFHYQASNLENLTGRCAKTRSKSLRDISRDYFDSEADHDFLSDAAVFGMLIATAAVPIVLGANAVIELFRSLPSF